MKSNKLSKNAILVNMRKNKVINKNNLKVGDVITLEVYGEECCDMCSEIIHNHIDCPICEDKYADTDQFTDLRDETELQCCCGTTYELVEGSWYNDAKVKIKELG